jgi:metal-responsive CopG/Arc/MetJ family transcriptional regulator
MDQTQVNLRCPTDQVEKLDELAEAIGVQRSEIVRRAIAVYIAQAYPVLEDMKAGRGGVWSYLFGPPVRQTGDASDQQMIDALNALSRELKKQRKTGPKGATA